MQKELPAFPCPCCHERTFTKRPVTNDVPDDLGTVLTHFHLCDACGENYLSTVHVAPDRSRTETWDYYLDRRTTLRRIRRYEPSGAHGVTETGQAFVVGDDRVSEAVWRAALAAARTAPSGLVEARAATLFADRWLDGQEPLPPSRIASFRPLHAAALGRRAA